MKSILLIVDRQPTPALLPILRSQQQGEILALLLGDPDLELSLTGIAARTSTPHASVHREIERAEQAGLVVTRKLGNTRLVRANTASPYYAWLAEVETYCKRYNITYVRVPTDIPFEDLATRTLVAQGVLE